MEIIYQHNMNLIMDGYHLRGLMDFLTRSENLMSSTKHKNVRTSFNSGLLVFICNR